MVERGNWGKKMLEKLRGPREMSLDEGAMRKTAAITLITRVREHLPENEREKSPYWGASEKMIQQIMCAQIILAGNEYQGRETPEQTKRIAKIDIFAVLENEPPENFTPSEVDLACAKILTTANRKRGKETPEWIKKLAEAKPSYRN